MSRVSESASLSHIRFSQDSAGDLNCADLELLLQHSGDEDDGNEETPSDSDGGSNSAMDTNDSSDGEDDNEPVVAHAASTTKSPSSRDIESPATKLRQR